MQREAKGIDEVTVRIKVTEISNCVRDALNAYAANGREFDLFMARRLFWIGLDLARLANKKSPSAATEGPQDQRM